MDLGEGGGGGGVAGVYPQCCRDMVFSRYRLYRDMSKIWDSFRENCPTVKML